MAPEAEEVLGRVPSPKPVQLRGTSPEDERAMNERKLMETFYIEFNKILRQERYKQWKADQDRLDADVSEFTLKNAEKEFSFAFTKSGVNLEIKTSDPETLSLVFAAVDCYQHAHAQHHKSHQVDFALTCNDEEEARQIIKAAMEKNVNITKLSFFNPDESKPNISQQELLVKIKAELKPKPSQQSSSSA